MKLELKVTDEHGMNIYTILCAVLMMSQKVSYRFKLNLFVVVVHRFLIKNPHTIKKCVGFFIKIIT